MSRPRDFIHHLAAHAQAAAQRASIAAQHEQRAAEAVAAQRPHEAAAHSREADEAAALAAALRQQCMRGTAPVVDFPPTCFMALIWAAEPTRLTERPTLMAGRIPL